MKRRITTLVVLAATALAVIFLLHFAVGPGWSASGGFVRSLRTGILDRLAIHILDSRSYYIVGVVDEKIVLGNGQNPAYVRILENGEWRSRIIDMGGYSVHIFTLSMDSIHFYLKDLATYTVYKGLVRDWKVDHVAFDSTFFSEAVPIGARSLIRRTIASGKYEYVLTKETATQVWSNDSLLQKQIDGLFCTDGMLRIDPVSARIVYVYFYRNEFFVADTSLNLVFRAHTIDTISRARIKVARILSDNTIKLSVPPFIVNRKSYVDGNSLYINSNVRSEVEELKKFNDASVIDVYDLQACGAYQYSFYLPHFNGDVMRTFAVENDLFVAVYDRHLITYRLRK